MELQGFKLSEIWGANMAHLVIFFSVEVHIEILTFIIVNSGNFWNYF